MIRKIALLMLIGLLWGCSKKEPIEFIGESFTESELDICQDEECPTLTVNYLRAIGDQAVADNINNMIQAYLIDSFVLEDRPDLPETFQKAAEGFVTSYFEDVALFPDSAMGYEAEVSVEELRNTPNIISFQLFRYLYTGGAHGYSAITFLNVNPENGEELLKEDLFDDMDGFVAFAEEKFRKERNIPEDQSINYTGFWFEDDQFYLPESVGVTNDSLVFVYNQYEIASYADGRIELSISLEEAKPYLKDFLLQDAL